jgi:hypothetical protein
MAHLFDHAQRRSRAVPPKASATVTIDSQLDEVWPVVIELVRDAKGRNVTADDATHTIKAGAGMSIFSWGENITVEAKAAGLRTELTIRSVSAMPLTLIDYGKNKANVNRLTDRLKERLSVVATA